MIGFINGLGPVVIISGIFLFCAVFLIVVGASAILAEQEFFRRRLAPSLETLSIQGAPRRAGIILEDGLLKQFDALVTPKNEAELTAIRKRLVQAGYRWPSAVRVFYASKAVLAFGVAIFAAIIIPLVASQLSFLIVGLVVLTAMLIGYFMPSFWLQREIEYRRQSAELGFPDLLDMLLICLESGNSLDQGARRVAREIRKVNKVLSDELGVVNDELYAGKSRTAVFRDFADRLNVQDISAFAAVLRQSDEFGVSIADTLRIYSAELRNKRLMRAEEKANMMPVKLALGSIAFTIPPTLLIMAGPSIIMIIRTFAGLGGN
jgi:tight adherence protein C